MSADCMWSEANSIEESHQWLVIDIQFKNRIMRGRGGEDKLEVDEIIMMSQPAIPTNHDVGGSRPNL